MFIIFNGILFNLSQITYICFKSKTVAIGILNSKGKFLNEFENYETEEDAQKRFNEFQEKLIKE